MPAYCMTKKEDLKNKNSPNSGYFPEYRSLLAENLILQLIRQSLRRSTSRLLSLLLLPRLGLLFLLLVLGPLVLGV